MNAFRGFLVAIVVTVALYTYFVIANHGFGLFSVFFGDMAEMAWPGQFNLDFMCFLLLSGLWLAWRNNFSPGGLVLGVAGVFGGAPLLAMYVLYASFQANGDVKELLLGKVRAAA